MVCPLYCVQFACVIYQESFGQSSFTYIGLFIWESTLKVIATPFYMFVDAWGFIPLPYHYIYFDS